MRFAEGFALPETMGIKISRDIGGHDGNLYNDKRANLNPLNSRSLLAYTRQWDKMCDISCFIAKNAEIFSFFLVFTLLQSAFMQ